jgi:hypothetical protein
MSTPPAVRNRQITLVLLALALVVRFVVVPHFEQLPESLDREAALSGEVKLFDVLPIEQEIFPVDATVSVSGRRTGDHKFKVYETARFNTLLSGQTGPMRDLVDYLLTQASIKNEYWERLKLLFGNDVREAEFWVDARRGTYITPEAAAGKQWVLPPGPARREDLALWDPITESGLTMRYAGEEKTEGVKLAVYKGEFGVYDLGSVELELLKQRVRIDASGTLTMKIAADTGFPISTTLETRLYAQVNVAQFDLLTVDFGMTEAAVQEALSEARWLGFWRSVGTLWAPLVLVLAGVWVWFRPVRAPRRGESRRYQRPPVRRRF